MSELISINKRNFKRGESGIVELKVGRIPSDTEIDIEAHVFRSHEDGPTVLILAGVHGDEINGVEIVRNFLFHENFNALKKGSLIIIPLLNVFGFINFDRYVPDGKDVNRSFPGTFNGSLASRIARTLTKHILPHVDLVFDFHTGGDSRYNFPQIRFSRNDQDAEALARIFNPPFIIQSGMIARSLRKTTREMKIPTLVYEGGESVRLDGLSIHIGLKGLKNCLQHLGMFEYNKAGQKKENTRIIKKTSWVRANYSGIFIWIKSSGQKVEKGEKLGNIHDPYGQKSIDVISHRSGYIIGHNNASVVNQGDALFHIGYEYEE